MQGPVLREAVAQAQSADALSIDMSTEEIALGPVLKSPSDKQRAVEKEEAKGGRESDDEREEKKDATPIMPFRRPVDPRSHPTARSRSPKTRPNIAVSTGDLRTSSLVPPGGRQEQILPSVLARYMSSSLGSTMDSVASQLKEHGCDEAANKIARIKEEALSIINVPNAPRSKSPVPSFVNALPVPW